MATVTAGQKFLGVSSSVDTTEKRSANINANTEYWSIETIQNLASVDVTAASLSLTALGTAPASATAVGLPGQIVIDANHIYICVATNTWKRAALSTF